MLSDEEIGFFREKGYLRVPGVFTDAETKELSDALDELVQTWAFEAAWTGPWREVLMDPEMSKRSRLTALHDLQLFSSAWARAVAHPRLVEVVGDLLGPLVELHHSTLHIKPPESGQPFPLHQDHPFYRHLDDRFVAVLVHLDDTCHENGEIRFLEGSHRQGPLQHITQTSSGPCTPFLPTDDYHIEDTVAVPAKAGDVVCMSINSIHGSYINSTPQARRLVRVGYRDPRNIQVDGQAAGTLGLMVRGERPKVKPPTDLYVAG